MQNAIKANEADSMFRLYSCSFGIACQKWHHDAAGCQKDSHLRVPNTQMAHIVAREELIDRSFYPLETSRNRIWITEEFRLLTSATTRRTEFFNGLLR